MPLNIHLPKVDPTATGKRTPKTPQDEAIAFFSGEHDGEPVQVWQLALEDDGGPGPGKDYIRLPPPTRPYILRFSLEPGTDVTRNGVLRTDFPIDGGAFKRDDFKERELPSDLSKPIEIDLPIAAPGAFCYFIEYDSPSGKGRIQGRRGYFNVDPIINLPARTPFFPDDSVTTINPLKDESSGAILPKNATLKLDSLIIISVLAKWMGKTDEWEPFFAEASRRGYNMLHWAPLQQRGISGSPYSIKDQLTFDPEILKNPEAKDGGLEEIEKVLAFAKEQYGLGGVTDVVLNHMAYDSPWLEQHPEAAYSPYNTPHLAPAVELENALLDLSARLPSLSAPSTINSESDLQALIPHIKAAIDSAKIWEFYVFDVQAEVRAVAEALLNDKSDKWDGAEVQGKGYEELAEVVKSSNIIDNYRAYSGRFITSVKPATAAGFIQAAYPEASPENQASKWGKVLDVLNVDLYNESNEDVEAAIEGVVGRLRFTRLEEGGPKLGEITRDKPLLERYFTHLPDNKTTSKHPESARYIANNGWMWAADPLKNFAEYPSKAYLRRQVIVWDDCVKLRYGTQPSDNPWLWEHMIKYAELLAGIFDGFRLDNCHSTPIEVGKAVIDAGRRVNPNLYVMAELFTGSQEMDLKFVRELGINSLVREAYNGDSVKNFADLLWRFGLGKPVGSMDVACLTSSGEINPSLPSSSSTTPRAALVTPLQGSAPHAVFYDLTHDNQSPADKRTAADALSTGALVTFCASALGSNKGFDDLYPKLLDLVTDNRKYEVVSKEQEREAGIGGVKRVLNALHVEMMEGGFTEGHVHEEGQYLMIHRVHPITHKGYMLVAHTAYKGFEGRGWVKPIRLGRTSISYLFGAGIETSIDQWSDDPSTHRGIPSKLVDFAEPEIKDGEENGEAYQEVVVPENFAPGSILVFGTQMSEISADLDAFCKEGAGEAMKGLDLVDLNVVLHRADGEEKDATGGDGVYTIPDYGALTFCGLEGWMHPLRTITKTNDLGHPLCQHLREGTWAFDYVVNRLQNQTDDLPHLSAPAAWFASRFHQIKATAPSFMRPKYFSLVILEAYKAARKAVIEQSSEFVASGHSLTHDLAMVSVQMYGLVKSASIEPGRAVPSLAAGLPHFTAGWARCWGRDVFISLRGLFLTTGNFEAAKAHIKSFGSTLKHGLIPNLLDSTRNPRYNCRDGPWWFIQNIQDYTDLAPNGLSILEEKVKRRFPADDTWVAWDSPRAYEWESTVAELVQEILQRHAEGIEFREYNAGPNLDMDMDDRGFDQKIWVDWSNGFIFGGNRYNCGTWMDKNGSSAKAGNKGLPATPRDGSPIEITGLLKSTLNWVGKLSEEGKWPAKGVNATVKGERRLVTYKEWADLLQANFEKHYYVPSDASEDDKYVINKSLVNRRGIYKDVYGTPGDREWSDYQFRSNFTLPMVVAPELFTPSKALDALRVADAVLRGPLGMKTLDPADQQYRGYYDNSNDSDDKAIAKGWNYHQGPEWSFPLGWFLMAYLEFDQRAGEGKEDSTKTLHYISSILRKLSHHIENDPWRGLPELTNQDGQYCYDSCNTQAWSASTILDVLQLMHKVGKKD
ncbi:glycogen debranching enzyme [Cryptococcus amylolentus CBS 6273]|uniref:Glycogen debranching enzyme n=1 Tax=Cryptococcus amylolentus CBS 6273 TaxID=1296118 RepID=A0A1E3KE55_9TREE|nr:glycogen debranching enzyme [Cryptococcus amylolentus CBS 6273]